MKTAPEGRRFIRLVVSLGFAPAKDAEAGKTDAQQRK
jgi:hypothetical protein